jgi:hypothetical protein
MCPKGNILLTLHTERHLWLKISTQGNVNSLLVKCVAKRDILSGKCAVSYVVLNSLCTQKLENKKEYKEKLDKEGGRGRRK